MKHQKIIIKVPVCAIDLFGSMAAEFVFELKFKHGLIISIFLEWFWIHNSGKWYDAAGQISPH